MLCVGRSHGRVVSVPPHHVYTGGLGDGGGLGDVGVRYGSIGGGGDGGGGGASHGG